MVEDVVDETGHAFFFAEQAVDQLAFVWLVSRRPPRRAARGILRLCEGNAEKASFKLNGHLGYLLGRAGCMLIWSADFSCRY